MKAPWITRATGQRPSQNVDLTWWPSPSGMRLLALERLDRELARLERQLGELPSLWLYSAAAFRRANTAAAATRSGSLAERLRSQHEDDEAADEALEAFALALAAQRRATRRRVDLDSILRRGRIEDP